MREIVLRRGKRRYILIVWLWQQLIVITSSSFIVTAFVKKEVLIVDFLQWPLPIVSRRVIYMISNYYNVELIYGNTGGKVPLLCIGSRSCNNFVVVLRVVDRLFCCVET